MERTAWRVAKRHEWFYAKFDCIKGVFALNGLEEEDKETFNCLTVRRIQMHIGIEIETPMMRRGAVDRFGLTVFYPH